MGEEVVKTTEVGYTTLMLCHSIFKLRRKSTHSCNVYYKVELGKGSLGFEEKCVFLGS